MKKILLALLFFTFSGVQGVNAEDLGGGFTDIQALTKAVHDKALALIGLKGDKETVVKYSSHKQRTVIFVKKALKTFIAYRLELKIMQGQPLTAEDRSMGEAVSKDDATFKAWLLNFYNTNFLDTLKNIPEGQIAHDHWKWAFIDTKVLEAKSN